MASIGEETKQILDELGVPQEKVQGGLLPVHTPISGEILAHCAVADPDMVDGAVQAADQAFRDWKKIPAPQRGELVRILGDELRTSKEALGRLVTIEAGKIASEGLGEVQEMIDICTYAAGLSRQLAGMTIPSERPHHRMMETWHPLGVTAIISAFNFPVAVWSWNAALALVCGNSVIWKPSEKTPLTALATQAVFERACKKFGDAPDHLASVLIGDREASGALADHCSVRLVSATGSTVMGKKLAPRIAARFGRAILELGGNNAAIVCPSADLALAVRAVAFSAMGTAGQRCTTLRRLIVHDSVADELLNKLKPVYESVTIGDPRDPGTLVGPLIDGQAIENMQVALAAAEAEGARVTGGKRVQVSGLPDGCYAQPAIVEMKSQTALVEKETFAPILYVLRYTDFEQALTIHNAVPQGLSSSIFTSDLREAEQFLSSEGSDCGIANVNLGPSGAEIGGAFGGEKDTGGGRESGSDVWKTYMRRATNTVNYGRDLPLAQGVRFDVDA